MRRRTLDGTSNLLWRLWLALKRVEVGRSSIQGAGEFAVDVIKAPLDEEQWSGRLGRIRTPEIIFCAGV